MEDPTCAGNENARPYYNIQEAETDHHPTVVEVAGNIVKQFISILIDPGSTHNYIAPRVVVKRRKSWLVQLATGTKRKVSELVEKCPLVMNGLVTCVDLNVLHK